MGTRAVPPAEPPPARQTPLFGRRSRHQPIPASDDFDIAPPDLGAWAWPIYAGLLVFCLVVWCIAGAAAWVWWRWCAVQMGWA